MKIRSMPVLLLLLMLCVGCSQDKAGSATGNAASAPAPDLMRLSAICHKSGGDWIKDKGCGMTEQLCTTTFHGQGTWTSGQGCMIGRGSNPNCNHEGAQTADATNCNIKYIPIADLQNMK